MKKIIIILLSISFFSSCKSTNITTGVVNTEPVNNDLVYKFDATPSGILYPVVAGEKIPPIIQKELIGALASIRVNSGKASIISAKNIDGNTPDENGIITRNLDLFTVIDNAGGLIRKVNYIQSVDFPNTIDLEIPIDSTQIRCFRFGVNKGNSNYVQKLDKDSRGTIHKNGRYQYTDPCDGKIYYTSEQMYLDNLFIKLVIDNRKKINSYLLPKTQN